MVTAAQSTAPETLSDALRRIALEEIDVALVALDLPGGVADQRLDRAVHEARRSLKRLRAVLRLVREPIGTRIYRRENGELRDVARMLAQVRASRVLLSTVRSLAAHYDLPKRTFRGAAAALDRHAASVRAGFYADGERVARVRAALQAVRDRLARWPTATSPAADGHDEWVPSAAIADDFGSLEPGIRRVYRRGRRRLRIASDDIRPETLHEWRKQAKYLRYHAELLGPIAPGPLGDLVGDLHHLTDLLGDHHDLFDLRQAIVGPEALADIAPGVRDAIAALVDRRRPDLEGAALSLGERLYASSPGEFVGSLSGLWDRGRTAAVTPLSGWTR